MRGHLPRTADFLLLAENNRKYEGLLPVRELERLHDVIDGTDGEVSVLLAFGWKYGVRSLSGSVSAELDLICQRCLQPMKSVINGSFCFALITDTDEIENLPDDMEPYVVEGDKQSVIDVVTDELLLSIPLVAKHEEVCSEYVSNTVETTDDGTYKPFASIKDLLDS